MNLFLNKRSIKELEMPAVVATKKNAGTQNFNRLFLAFIVFWGSASHLNDEFAQDLFEPFFKAAVDEVCCGYGSVFGFHIPVRGIANGTPHAVRTFV
jgi:hypothetical protein